MESTNETLYFFPLEVLVRIFADVDLQTLVFSCRHVCRFWKDAVENPELWKLKISHEHADKFETDNLLLAAHEIYPWYICYAICRNVFNRNMFPGCAELPGNPSFWRSANKTGFILPDQFHVYRNEFPRPPEELLETAENGCLLCFIGESNTLHCVDLYAHGLTKQIMRFQPPINISEWYAARFDHIATCHIEVKLFTSEWSCDTRTSFFRNEHVLRWRDWSNISHTFKNYGPDVRYVVFHHGINTTLPHFLGTVKKRESTWATSKMAGTVVTVSRPEPGASPVSTSSSGNISSGSSSDS